MTETNLKRKESNKKGRKQGAFQGRQKELSCYQPSHKHQEHCCMWPQSKEHFSATRATGKALGPSVFFPHFILISFRLCIQTNKYEQTNS